ncbi:hypothetical protein AB1E18_019650 [Capra hircus]
MSCSHSPQLPSPDGRREVPSAPLPAPPTLRTARSSHSASGALTGRWKRPQAARAPTSPTNSCRRRVTPIPLSAERALLSCGRTVPGHAPCGTRFLRMLQGQSFSFLCAQVPTSLVHGISRLLCARARRASPLLDCTGPPDMGSAKPHLLRERRGWSLPAFLCTCGASPSPEHAQQPYPRHSCARSVGTPGNFPACVDHPSPQHARHKLHFPDHAAWRETLPPRPEPPTSPIGHLLLYHAGHRHLMCSAWRWTSCSCRLEQATVPGVATYLSPRPLVRAHCVPRQG